MANTSVDGLISGLKTTDVISQLMQLERQPQARLESKRDAAKAELGVYQALNTKFAALSSASLAVSRAVDWKAMKATSSAADAVTASATGSAQTGTLSFTVRQLSRAGSVASSGTVASTTVLVATGPFLLSKGADQLGFASLGSGAGLTLGAHTVEVTQAGAGAAQVGTTALAAATTFAADATLDVTVDGVAKTYTVRAGTYTAAGLAAEVQRASGGDLSGSVDGAGRLRLVTTHEGSTAGLQITGGTAVADLFLDPVAPATTGTDGAVKVDGSAAITVDSAGPGRTKSLAGPNGTVEVAFSGGLRIGTVTVTNVDTGNGSLAALVEAVNRAGTGIGAAAVKVGNDSYRLQLTSTTTGANSNITAGTQNLGASLGTLSTVQSGRDAVIRVGEGTGAYEVASSTDAMADVLPGVSLTLRKADPAATVTVTVGRDADALAAKVAGLVDAANGALSYIKLQGSYDATTKQAGILLSNGMARTLQQQVYQALSATVGTSSLGSAGGAGISVARDGTVSFDKSKFTSAYAKDPEAAAALFRQGGTATDGRVSFLSAASKTRPGTYAVAITQAATRAAAAGSALNGAGLVGAETIDVRVGGASGTTATYTAGAGATLATVADGLNAAFAEKSLAVSAVVEGGTLVLRSATYGSQASFEVRASASGAGDQTGLVAMAGVWEAHAGTDVAGTIKGVAATGAGQVLTGSATDADVSGLALTVTATSAGALGTFTYVPGVAQRLNSMATAAVDFGTGPIKGAISGRESFIRELDDRIGDWDARLAQREKSLKQQYTGLETALGKLKNQSSWLAGQLASLPSSS